MREETLLFGNPASLVGIITEPPQGVRSHNLPALILLNAGIVHRVGPNRLYVKLARRLAAMGFVVLRFDFSGIGDSKGREDGLPFEKSSVSETQEAMDALSEAKGAKQFILFGLCSGAVASFQTAWHDPRVLGIVLMNAQDYFHDELISYVSNRRIAQAYRGKVFNPKSWVKVLTGKAHYQGIIKTIRFQLESILGLQRKALSEANHIRRKLGTLAERSIHILLIYSDIGQDIDYRRVVVGDQSGWMDSYGKLKVEVIPGADHTFNSLSSQEHLFKVIKEWIQPLMQY
jgi:pimeloyl-ACP methyl ester carboxylesterase